MKNKTLSSLVTFIGIICFIGYLFATKHKSTVIHPSSISHIQMLTQDTFEQYIKKSKDQVVIIKFFTPWCGPCKKMDPILQKIAHELQNGYCFVSVNIDTESEIAQRYAIRSIPTIIILYNGVVKERIIGFINEKELKEKIMVHHA